MLQNPQIAFRDLRLRECRIEMDRLGQPRPRSGNFATVYRANLPDGTALAVKVFNRRAEERRERYRAISADLEQHRPEAVVRFEYDERGIRSGSDGKLYPLLTMDWVDGLTLFDWARERSLAGDTAALDQAAEDWLELTGQLAAAGIVHGDLQHGNVMVSPQGRIRLVDYDGMAVPSLFGQTNPEVGLPPYQHPLRDADTLIYPGLDNFSALVIYVALRALALEPRLWDRHVEQRANDKLLFDEHDFAEPGQSQLLAELTSLGDPELRGLVHYLLALAGGTLAAVPPLGEVRLWCRSLEELLTARDWHAAVQLALRLGPAETVPDGLQPLLTEACRRVVCRRLLDAAIAADDDWEIARNYVPELIDDLPDAAPLLAPARRALELVPILRQLEALRADGRWPEFDQLWKRHSAELATRPAAEPFRLEAARLAAVATLAELIERVPPDPAALETAWQHLQSLGGHAAAADLLARLEPLLDHQQARRRLEAILSQRTAEPLLAHDDALLAAWNPVLAAADPELARNGPLWTAVRERVELHRRLVQQIARGPATIQTEREIARLASLLPASYDARLVGRVQLARRRARAIDRLASALVEPTSDVAIALAWRDLSAAQRRNWCRRSTPAGSTWRWPACRSCERWRKNWAERRQRLTWMSESCASGTSGCWPAAATRRRGCRDIKQPRRDGLHASPPPRPMVRRTPGPAMISFRPWWPPMAGCARWARPSCVGSLSTTNNPRGEVSWPLINAKSAGPTKPASCSCWISRSRCPSRWPMPAAANARLWPTRSTAGC